MLLGVLRPVNHYGYIRAINKEQCCRHLKVGQAYGIRNSEAMSCPAKQEGVEPSTESRSCMMTTETVTEEFSTIYVNCTHVQSVCAPTSRPRKRMENID